MPASAIVSGSRATWQRGWRRSNWQPETEHHQYLRRGELPAISSRADAEFGAECAIEVGDIAEAAVEGHIQNLCPSIHQSYSGLTQACPQNELVRRKAGQVFESAKKVIRAKACLTRQACQGEPGVGITLDRAQRS